jgi:hypothetical protein
MGAPQKAAQGGTRCANQRRARRPPGICARADQLPVDPVAQIAESLGSLPQYTSHPAAARVASSSEQKLPFICKHPVPQLS